MKEETRAERINRLRASYPEQFTEGHRKAGEATRQKFLAKPLKPIGNPIIRALAEEMRAQGYTVSRMSIASGVARDTIEGWKSGRRAARLDLVEACFNVLGKTLRPVARC